MKFEILSRRSNSQRGLSFDTVLVKLYKRSVLGLNNAGGIVKPQWDIKALEGVGTPFRAVFYPIFNLRFALSSCSLLEPIIRIIPAL